MKMHWGPGRYALALKLKTVTIDAMTRQIDNNFFILLHEFRL